MDAWLPLQSWAKHWPLKSKDPLRVHRLVMSASDCGHADASWARRSSKIRRRPGVYRVSVSSDTVLDALLMYNRSRASSDMSCGTCKEEVSASLLHSGEAEPSADSKMDNSLSTSPLFSISSRKEARHSVV